MPRINNDGAKTPMPDPDENKVVEFMPTCHQYKVAHLTSKDLELKNTEQLLMELGCLGADGYLLLSIIPSPEAEGMFIAFFARTGIKVPKPGTQQFDIPPGFPRGIIGPDGRKL